MHTSIRHAIRHTLRPAILAAALLASPAWAQLAGACSSDGVPRPLGLIERFINAGCGDCWRHEQTPGPGDRELAIDWVLPGSAGNDAPLSAVASLDGLSRLQALGRHVPDQVDTLRSPLVASVGTLRVAQGPVLNDYVAVSIELESAGRGPWTAWLLLVEHLPVGTARSPIARDLVRGALRADWTPSDTAERRSLLESRSMRLPEGARPERLRVVGWVEDARGRIMALAHSQCAPTLKVGR